MSGYICFYYPFKLSWNIDFLKNIIFLFFFVVFLNTTFSEQSNKSITFDFWSITTSSDTKFLLPKPSNHWKTDQY